MSQSDNAQNGVGLESESKSAPTVSEAQFLDAMAAYADVSSILNAYFASKNKDGFFTDLVSRCQIGLAALRRLAEDGRSFTPPKDLAFGSDNASDIALGIMGLRVTNGKLRSTATKVGKARLGRK